MVGQAEERRAVEVFAELLEQQDAIRREYQDKPRELLERYGFRFPDKVALFFDDVYEGRVTRAVVTSGRSGGKTKSIAGLGFGLWFLGDWCVFIVGGSEEQAKVGIGYVHDLAGEPEVSEELEAETTKTLLVGKRGAWVKAAPASTKAIRGQHAKGRKLILFLDEEAEMDGEIVRAALHMGRDAEVFVVVRASTIHKVTGTFIELWDRAGKLGYRKYGWTSFDVAERCDRPCSECFREHYPDWHDDLAGIHALEKEFHDRYCREVPKSNRQGGWISLAEMRQVFIEVSREEFEVEVMGWRPRGEGSVLPADKVRAAYAQEQPPAVVPGVPLVCGVDWGFRGSTAVEFVQYVGRAMNHLASAEFTGTLVDGVIGHLDDVGGALLEESTGRAFDESRRREVLVYADSSHPYNNEQLRQAGFCVEEVVFGAFKETGAGALARFFELGLVTGCSRFKKCVSQLLGWRRNKAGKIVKSEDHHPDALLCTTRYATDRQAGQVTRTKVDIRSLGRGFTGWFRSRGRGRGRE